MKKLTLLFIAAALFGCQPEADNTDDLAVLNAEKDSLLSVKKEVAGRLAEIQEQLAKLDTTQKLALVSVSSAEQKTFRHYFTVHGVAETDQNIMVYAQSQGKIDVIKVKEGDRVSKGQVIAIQNTDVLKKNMSEMETRFDLAQTVFQRQEKLWNQKIGSEIQYLQAKNNRDALKKSIQTLQEQIEMANIVAPFSGVVDEVFVKAGEMPVPGMGVLRLINLEKMYIEASVTENKLSKIKVGDSVLVRFPSIDYTTTSSIKRIGNFINPNNRTFKMVVEVMNKDNTLKPNLLAEIDVLDFEAKDAVVVPSNFIMQGSGGSNYVFVTDASTGVAKAMKKKVQVGMSYLSETLVENGITAADVIITKGARSIKDGDLVEISNN